MKTLMYKKSIASLMAIVMLFGSCYTVKDKMLVTRSKFPTTEQKLPGEYYIVNNIQAPSPQNPYGLVETSKASKYKYQVMERYERESEINAGATIGTGVLVSGLSGLLFMSNPMWFDEGTMKSQAFLGGLGIGAIAWWALISMLPDKRTDYIDVKGFDYEYKVDQVLSEKEILVKHKNTEKTYLTDVKGLLKLSPPFDFKLDEFKTNDTIEFYFSSGNEKFANSLKLNPSDWMDRYAKISVPKCVIGSENKYEELGFAREGMLYKVLDVSEGRIHIQLGSKMGWIDSANALVSYTMNTRSDLSPAIKNYVNEEMQKWMQQGEFELAQDYLNRLSRKDEQLLLLTNQAMQTFQKEYANSFDWQKSSISNYDPNSQTFKVNIPGLKEIVVPVPIQYAREFKTNWSNNNFKNQEFTMINGQWELVSLQIEDSKQSYTAEYNSSIKNNYDPVNQFAFDFKDYEPDLSKLNIKPQANVIKENSDVEKYSINTNLPRTSMSQPDAIAVVIGNAMYQKTDPVNFAMNDAQLMKLYLTEVLGFKEGNIIFLMNAGKADFEGLFGTESNHRGKLFNYIKPNISDVFIFYSGHGAPDPQTAEPYFVPVDCDPAYLNLQAYSLRTLYSNLAKLPAKSTTVIIDACFSGAGVLRNISSVRIKPKDTESDIPNSAVISSSGGEQVSSWHNEARHGLFTYFFLKAIHDYKNSDQNGDNELTFTEIHNYVSDKTKGVPYFARRLNAVEQTPVLKGNNPERVFVKY